MAVRNYANLPLVFEANVGQSSPQVRFISRGPAYTTFLTSDEAVLELVHKQAVAKPSVPVPQVDAAPQTDHASTLRMKLVGANPQAPATGLQELSGKSNYFVGKDPKKWRTAIPGYAKVKYKAVYPGIDLVYYGNQRQLEYDFVVAPYANPQAIQFEVTGSVTEARGNSAVRVDGNGDLVIGLSGGDVRFHKPVLYQPNLDARSANAPDPERDLVSGRYVVAADHRVGFQVDRYDRNRPLIIDPTLSYSTFLGGNDFDVTHGIAVDSSGYTYVVGETASANFPVTAGAYDTTCESCPYRLTDAFVTKLNPDGSAIVYSTFIGGTWNNDKGSAIALDASGNAYIVGYTDSPDFPTTANAFQHGADGDYSWNTFISKLSPNGDSLVFSTLLGGNQQDFPGGVAVDGSGAVYVTGNTNSENFPTKNPLQSTYGGGYECGGGYIAVRAEKFPSLRPMAHDGDPCPDAYVTKLKPDGSDLVYSTYLGKTHDESGTAIAVDSSGNAYVAGSTNSGDFPTHNALQPNLAGGYDEFILKLNPSGSTLLFSTFLGGTGDENLQHLILDSTGNIYVTGSTTSSDYPVMNPSQSAISGGSDAFVSKINAAGGALLYSTYLGGSDGEVGEGITLDASRNIYIVGETSSTDFPTVKPVQSNYGGSGDLFVTELPAAGGMPVFSTYLGGSSYDGTGAGTIGVDGTGNIFVAGYAYSTDFPIENALQPTFGGVLDAVVVKISPLTAAGVSLAPTSLDFGNQPKGVTSTARTSVITNTGTESLKISSIAIEVGTDYQQTSDCPISPSVLAGGAHCTITVTFKPTAVGTRQDQVVITSNASGSPHTLGLTGYGEPPAPAVTLSTRSITFAEQLVGTSSAAQTVTLTNSGSAALAISSVAGQDTDFLLTSNCPIWPSTLDVSSQCTLTVTFVPGARGNHSDSIVITDNASDSPQDVALSGRGIVPAAVQLSTTTLDFGAQLLGSSSSPQSVTLTNSGDQDLTISSITAAGDFSVTQPCSPTTLGGNASCSISLKFTPTATGVRDSSLTITHNAAGSPATITLKGSGQDFALATQSGGSTSATVSAGSTASYQLQITPSGYSGTVNLTCRFQGTQPQGTSCSVVPASVTLNGTDSATFTVSVPTTARAAAAAFGPLPATGSRPSAYLVSILLFTLCTLTAMTLGSSGRALSSGRKRMVWAPLNAMLFLVLLCSMPGCGSGSSIHPRQQTGTPAGTYSITLSAAAGGVTKTSALTLVVN